MNGGDVVLVLGLVLIALLPFVLGIDHTRGRRR